VTKILQVIELAKNLRLSNEVVLELCLQLAIPARNEFAWILDSHAERVQAKAIKDGLINYEDDTGKLFSAGCLYGCPVGWKDSPCRTCNTKLLAKKLEQGVKAHQDIDPPIRLVVFDLDGTLANTGGLPSGVRTPYQVLAPGIDTLTTFDASGHDTTLQVLSWSFGPHVSNYPGKLIASGYKVAIVTRAPLPYASTLIHLLGISTLILKTSCGMFEHEKAKVLTELAEEFALKPNEMIYIGDLEEDEFVAGIAKCKFVPASRLHSGDLPLDLPALVTKTIGVLIGADSLPAVENNAMGAEPLTIDSLRIMITSSIKSGIGDTELHSTLLKQFTEKMSSEHDKQTLSGLAFFSLLTRPGSPRRPYWQTLLFANLESGSAHCLICSGDGLFQIDPRIITRNEINESQIENYLNALRRCFPGSRVVLSDQSKNTSSNKTPLEQLELDVEHKSLFLRSAFKFSADLSAFGSFLSLVKNHTKYKGSGPNVQLGYIDFIADILASYIAELNIYSEDIVIVPVPSSSFNERNVGQVSTRLAFCVGQRLKIPVWPVVKKSESGENSRITGFRNFHSHLMEDDKFEVTHLENWLSLKRSTQKPLEAILVEDQSTTGNSIRAVARTLRANGIRVNNAVAYSATFVTHSSFENPHWTSCIFGKISREVGLKCLCDR